MIERWAKKQQHRQYVKHGFDEAEYKRLKKELEEKYELTEKQKEEFKEIAGRTNSAIKINPSALSAQG